MKRSKIVTLTAVACFSLVAQAKIEWTFDNNSMEGWHNRAWVTNTQGVGVWADLRPNQMALRALTEENGGVIYPADSGNTLYWSTKTVYPYDKGRGSYLTLGNLDAGKNTKWARSPRFRITETGDLTFKICYGKNDAPSAPANESMVPAAALSSKGWTGVCLCDCETGNFVLTQIGCQKTSFTSYSFTAAQMQAAGVTADKDYTLDVMTLRADRESWIALEDVSIPGVLVDPVVTALHYDFDDNTLNGWHNRVWDLSLDGGNGLWTDLLPDVTEMPTSINEGKIHPIDAHPGLVDNNNLFIASASGHPKNLSCTCAIVKPQNLNAGDNTRWLRSPEFFLDGSDVPLTFELVYGRNKGALREWESMVDPIGRTNSLGWAGLCLRDAETGQFVLSQKGSDESSYLQTHTFTVEDLKRLDLTHAYTLDLISARAGYAGWIGLDNVFVPGSAVDSFLTGVSFGALGSVKRISSEMVFCVPPETDVTALAPTLTLGAGATSDIVSGAVRDFTTPQTFTVTSKGGAKHTFRISVVRLKNTLPVTNGLVARYRADMGVVANAAGQVLRWASVCGDAPDLLPWEHKNPPAFLPDPARSKVRSAISFRGPYEDASCKTGQAFVSSLNVAALPHGKSARTIFMRARYQYGVPPKRHGWGGFAYGASPLPNVNSDGYQATGFISGSVIGLVSTQNNLLQEKAEQTLAVQGWGSGMDFPFTNAAVGDKWFTQSVVLEQSGNGVTFRHYLNGELIGTKSPAYNTGRGLIVVGGEIDLSPFQSMDLCEVLVYDRVLSDEERQAVDMYLKQHWYSSGLVLCVH